MRSHGANRKICPPISEYKMLSENSNLSEGLLEAQKTIQSLESQLRFAHEELQKTSSELLHMTLQLEDRVSKRTIELKKANTELRRSEKKLRKIMGGTIEAITATVERRDLYTAGHQRRVADLARTIAAEMGLPKEKVEGIRVAGVLHDLGKISIPSDILSKPDHLSEIEFELIKTHPQVAFDILNSIDFDMPIAQIVLQHHERIDGSGYPQGLSGKDILIEARILALADVVEAMVSHRPYRPALGIGAALEEVKTNKGIHYDPDVVDVFIGIIDADKYDFKSFKSTVIDRYTEFDAVAQECNLSK